MEDTENPLERDLSLSVVLPGGLVKTASVHGSKPVIDLLVTLCASYHLNPSDYTVEVLSANKNNVSFKPNSPIGSLDAERIVLKPKAMEEKIRRPYMPEATVRLLINYRKSHKAVVRVNPRAPLELLLPVICNKCEFDVETTILLRDSKSQEPLDLSMSLNDHGLREVFAKDTAVVPPAEVITPPPAEECAVEPLLPKKKEKKQKQKENKGFLSLFRRSKKKETDTSQSAPASPGLGNQRGISLSSLAIRSSNTLPADTPKKRQAPQPPLGVSQSVPNNLSTHHLKGSQSSTESTLNRTKRRAPPPPPPCGNTQREEAEEKGTVSSLYPLQEQREGEELDSPATSLSPSSLPQQPFSSPSPSPPSSSSSSSLSSEVHLQEVNNKCPLTGLSSDTKLRDQAPPTLAQILVSSMSNGTADRRLRTSATFPRVHGGSLCHRLTRQCPHNASLRSELRSKLGLRPCTDSKWEDPRERKVLNTFTVVPARKQKSYEVVLTLETPDQSPALVDSRPTSKASSTADGYDEEEPGHLEGQEAERPTSDWTLDTSSSPALLSSSKVERSPTPPTPTVEEDMVNADEGSSVSTSATDDSPLASPSVVGNGDLPCDADREPTPERASTPSPHGGAAFAETNQTVSDAEADGDVQEEDEDIFPPPPPPVFYDEEAEEREEPPSAASDVHGDHFGGDHVPKPTSPKPCLPPHMHLKRVGTVPSRFAQAVALAVQRSRSRGQSFQVANGPSSITPPAPGPCTDTVPEWPPHTSMNGSSCLG